MPPPDGVALAFGKDAQQNIEQLEQWTDWAQQPGRVLVLMPPFQRGACDVPTPWDARRAEPLAGGEAELVRVLARERQHELRGELVPVERVAGQIVTGLWRRHPTAGLFVVTTLPLWSLAVLDHRAALRAWLDDLVAQAGSPRAMAEPSVERLFRPSPHDWAVSLHLCTGPYPDAHAALEALGSSTIFRIPASAASEALTRLQAAGWAQAGELTGAGRQALAEGPYALQARTLTRMSHV